ncbi:hypothetical protein [Halomonas ramblicola]|uniref:hypothetical protein n=1 Tax=Halomonas ramblicola TaxID=747349 RepID=UPI0025B54826|nr:hypothetical protein [Halomonas ramblicola]MDN3520295.1 hypothetical protein [Halomonas ramblicola]
MKTVWLKMAVLPLALLFGASVAVANPASFSDLDVDGDGALSAEEAAAVEGLDFEAADADGDGALNEEEFEAAKGEMEGTKEGETGMEGETTAE